MGICHDKKISNKQKELGELFLEEAYIKFEKEYGYRPDSHNDRLEYDSYEIADWTSPYQVCFYYKEILKFKKTNTHWYNRPYSISVQKDYKKILELIKTGAVK